MPDTSTRKVPAPAVAMAAWLLPGAGYWLLGQRARALAVGITVIILFVAGLLIGGVRLVEVPGFGDHGERLVVSQESREDSNNAAIEHTTEQSAVPAGTREVGWVMAVHPLDEIRNKPWYIAQVLTGPINLIASWGSVDASRVGPDNTTRGFRSHSRTNELGVLYTAVAGMLNLLAIIDATSRAGSEEEA